MGQLRTLWEWWRRVARRLGDVQARLLLTLFYFVIFGPFALIVRWRSDPLAIKAGTLQGWRPRANGRDTAMERAGRQS